MGVRYQRCQIIPEGTNPLQASWWSLLASHKVAGREAYTEGSGTAKSGTEDHERYTEAN